MCEILQEQYGLSYDDANKCTTQFLRSFRSCPDNSQTTLDSWRSYLWSESLPNNLKHLNIKIYEKWLNLRYHYLSIIQEYDVLLKNLRKYYRLALITNGPSNAQWEKIHKLNLSNYFDCILVSSDLPWEKPNQNIFLTACNILNVKPYQCLMIGDKIETDIKGAKDAKLGAAIWIPLNPQDIDPNNLNIQPVPDIIIDNLTQIMKYLPSTTSSTSSTSTSDNENCFSTRRRRSLHQSSTTTTSNVTSQSTFLTRRHPIYKRVSSLPEFDGSSDNSLDSCYS